MMDHSQYSVFSERNSISYLDQLLRNYEDSDDHTKDIESNDSEMEEGEVVGGGNRNNRTHCKDFIQDDEFLFAIKNVNNPLKRNH